ncbi:MAG: 6-phospho-beta-glucosidase, partial [Actinomycetes bacterium]
GGHKAIGLCNVAIGFERRFAAQLGVPIEAVSIEQVGLNHLSWIRSVTTEGEERLPEILDRFGEDVAADVGVSLDLMLALKAIPSYYLHYFYCHHDALQEMKIGPTRAEEVMEIERELLSMYADSSLVTKPKLLEQRGGAYYSEAAARLVSSLMNDTGDVQVVDVLNRGTLTGLPDDAVVEVPSLIDKAGAHPLPQQPLAPEMIGLVQHVTAYEQLAVQAAVSGDRTIALRALLAHPLIGEWSVAEPMLDAMLEANQQDLPAFWS